MPSPSPSEQGGGVRLIFDDSSEQGFSVVVKGDINGIESQLRTVGQGWTSFEDQDGRHVVVNCAHVRIARSVESERDPWL